MTRLPYFSMEIDFDPIEPDWRWKHIGQNDVGFGFPHGCFDIVMAKPNTAWLRLSVFKWVPENEAQRRYFGPIKLIRISWLCFGIEMQMGGQQ